MEQELHRLRHGISMLAGRLSADAESESDIADSIGLGCRSVYHLVRLQAPRLDHESHTKDIDFVPSSIEARWLAGKTDMLRALAARVWETPVGPEDGVVFHDFSGSGQHETTEGAAA
jgi:NTE family protein